MGETLRLSKTAVHLTQSFQQAVGSVALGYACRNALNICTGLISEEKKGSKPLVKDSEEPKTFTLASILEEITKDPVFIAAKQSTAKPAVKFSNEMIADIKTIASYADIEDSLEDVYLMIIMAANNIYEGYKNGNSSVSFDMHSTKGLVEHQFWLN